MHLHAGPYLRMYMPHFHWSFKGTSIAHLISWVADFQQNLCTGIIVISLAKSDIRQESSHMTLCPCTNLHRQILFSDFSHQPFLIWTFTWGGLSLHSFQLCVCVHNFPISEHFWMVDGNSVSSIWCYNSKHCFLWFRCYYGPVRAASHWAVTRQCDQTLVICYVTEFTRINHFWHPVWGYQFNHLCSYQTLSLWKCATNLFLRDGICWSFVQILHCNCSSSTWIFSTFA